MSEVRRTNFLTECAEITETSSLSKRIKCTVQRSRAGERAVYLAQSAIRSTIKKVLCFLILIPRSGTQHWLPDFAGLYN